MTLTPAVKLHPTALVEAKLHCVGKTGGGGEAWDRSPGDLDSNPALES